MKKKITKKVLSSILLCGMLTAGVFGAQLVQAAVVDKPAADGVYYITEGDTLNLRICLRGDVTGEGDITMADVTAIRRYIADSSAYPLTEEDCGDANIDTFITMADVTTIRRYIADSEAYPIPEPTP